MAAVTLVAILAFTGCAGQASNAEIDPPATGDAVTYPIPDGCPTGEAFGTLANGESDWAVPLQLAVVESQLPRPLPPGACAYAVQKADTAKNGSKLRRVVVAYFNVGAPGKITEPKLNTWARAVGGIEEPDHESSWALPDDLTGWTGAKAQFADGKNSMIFFGEGSPEFLQAGQGRIDFWMEAELVDALVAQSESGVEAAPLDPAESLAMGLASQFTGTFEATDKQGYTVNVKVEGSLEPFTSVIENSPPGEFMAVSPTKATWSFTNTTDGRKSGMPSAYLALVYPEGSVACERYASVSTGEEIAGAQRFCQLTLGHVSSPISMAPGGSETMTTSKGGESGPHSESGDALAVVNAPTSLYVYFGRDRSATPDWTSPAGCAVGNISAVVVDGWPDVLCGKK